MNTCGHLLILCVLLLALRDVFCDEFDKKKTPLSKANGREPISIGDFFKSVWRTSKHRRSVRSVGNGQLKTRDLEETPQTKPQSECGESLLTVILKQADVISTRIYGPRGDLLHLGQLAAFCGVSIKTAHTDVRLLFNYDSCYLKKEETKYVLSLSWYGTDLDLSCPVSVTPPTVVCKNNVMELTVVGDGTADELSVALNGEWAPLLYVATQCWRRELSNQGELTFSFSYTSCGVNLRDGRFIVYLRTKDKVMPLSCPYDPVPVFPVKDFGLSAADGISHKPSTVLPSRVIGRQMKQPQMFPYEQQERNAARTASLHPRAPWLPKLPGSFNLAVNFPFSLPIPTQPVPIRDHLTSESVDPTPTPTPAPSPAPTPTPVSSTTQQLPPSDINEPHHVSYEQTEQDFSGLVTKSPPSQFHYMQYPYVFQKPALTSSQTELPSQQYQASRTPVSSTALYQPFGSAPINNVPRPNPLQVHPALASFAQYLPPGYFICPYNNPQSPVVPHSFQPSIPNLAQTLQYQKPSYHKPDIAQFGPAIPAMPLMNDYSEQQLISAIASSPQDSATPLFQPTQHFQPSYFYQSSRQGSTNTPLSSVSPLIPINLQYQTRPYASYPSIYDTKPSQPQHYQNPSQPSGSVQNPWSTSHLPVKVLSQESRLSSSQTPEYLQYQTGRDQSLDLYQRSVLHTPDTGISSHSQYQPSQLSKFPYPPLRPEVLSADVSKKNSQKGFFQPRSIAPVPSPKAQTFTGNRPFISLPPPAPHEFTVKEGARLPYSQGPSVRYMQDPYVHPERPREPSSQKPQNDTLPQYEFFRQASLAADIYAPPHFRSSSQREEPAKKASGTGSYFYKPRADAVNN